MIIENGKTLEYKEVFRNGDLIRSKVRRDFCDGTFHYVGQLIKVSELTLAYYNWHTDDYVLVKSVQ